MDDAIRNHPMYTDSDYAYFRRKGYTDDEVLAFWDRDRKRGCEPVHHRPAPDMVERARRSAARETRTPMAGVSARPLHERGTCSLHTEHENVNLWRVSWGDGVKMDLCTGCMASLVFEE